MAQASARAWAMVPAGRCRQAARLRRRRESPALASQPVTLPLTVVERRELPIEFRDRVLEHAAVVRRTGQLEIRKRASARKHEGSPPALSSGVLAHFRSLIMARRGSS